MRAVESANPRQDDAAGGRTRSWATKGSGITFAVMVVVLLVALLFAANQNDVIGWLLVIISAGWLVLAILVVLGVRRGAQSVNRRMMDMSASLAPRAPESTTTRVVTEPVTDPMRDTKLDHSFKIVQVQVRVITEELDKGESADADMVARALETIHITASNARDMIKQPDAGTSGTKASGGTSFGSPAAGAETSGPDGPASSSKRGSHRRGSSNRGSSTSGSAGPSEGPISGEVIN